MTVDRLFIGELAAKPRLFVVLKLVRRRDGIVMPTDEAHCEKSESTVFADALATRLFGLSHFSFVVNKGVRWVRVIADFRVKSGEVVEKAGYDAF